MLGIPVVFTLSLTYLQAFVGLFPPATAQYPLYPHTMISISPPPCALGSPLGRGSTTLPLPPRKCWGTSAPLQPIYLPETCSSGGPGTHTLLLYNMTLRKHFKRTFVNLAANGKWAGFLWHETGLIISLGSNGD